MTRSMSLQVHLTKYCNASCAYCSSWTEDRRYMLTDDYRRSLIFVIDYWRTRDLLPKHLTIQYLGGEISTVPFDEVRQSVLMARNIFAQQGVEVLDGLQTNLLMGNDLLREYMALFSGRISSSLPDAQRTMNGQAELYKARFEKSDERYMRYRGRRVPVVVVLNKDTWADLAQIVDQALRDDRDITLTTVFNGRRPVEEVSPAELAEALGAAFERWFMADDAVRVEPLATLVNRVLDLMRGREPEAYCNFQSDCIDRSLSLTPSGELYLCQEASDMGMGRLGNALNGDVDEDARQAIARRREGPEPCRECEYWAVCRGGCGLQGYARHGSWLSQPPYCPVWKSLFTKIKQGIEQTGVEPVSHWVARL